MERPTAPGSSPKLVAHSLPRRDVGRPALYYMCVLRLFGVLSEIRSYS